MDFYVFVTYVPQYGENAFIRSKNKFLIVMKKGVPVLIRHHHSSGVIINGN
jgi:hypothetical protein